jgi:hypothetical protein
LMLRVSSFGSFVMKANTRRRCSDHPSQRAIVAPPDTREGQEWSVLMTVQCEPVPVAGFSPLDSQYDDAGTKQRRWSNQFFQNELVRTLSSRTLVTRRGALPF